MDARVTTIVLTNEDGSNLCKITGNIMDKTEITIDIPNTLLIYSHAGKELIRRLTIPTLINKAITDNTKDIVKTIVGEQFMNLRKQ